VQDVTPGLSAAITIHGKSGVTHLVLLSAEQAANLWRVNFKGRKQLVLSESQVYSDGEHLILRQIGQSSFDAAFFPAGKFIAVNGATVTGTGKQTGIFQTVNWHEPERTVTLQLEQTRVVGKAPLPLMGPKAPWRHGSVVMAPDEASFSEAGEWKVVVPQHALDGLSDLYLRVQYQGDEARLLNGNRLLTDNFFNGVEWRIGLKRFLPDSAALPLLLQILPLSQKAPIFFEPGKEPNFGSKDQVGVLDSVDAIPEYEIELSR
jgi:hypothetical protein